MTTGATGQLGLALPVQGELSGTWGDTVNNGITQYTNIAIAATLTLTNDGAVTLANTTGDASASNIVSSLTGAGTVTAQFAIVRVTGTLTTTKVVTFGSAGSAPYSKTYVVVNAATGGSVSFTAYGGSGVTVAVGESAYVYYNGTNIVKVSSTVATGVTSFQTSLSGLTPSTATTGAVTLAGTLGTANGGTNLTSFTSGGVVYASSSSALATGSALTFDGASLGIGTTSPIRRLTVSNSGAEGLEIGPGAASGDTAGAVTSIYYNRSGSAYVNAIQSASNFIYQISGTEGMRLTSTGLGIGTSSPSAKLNVYSTAGAIVAKFDSNQSGGAQIGFYGSGTINGYVGTSGNWLGTSATDMAIIAETSKAVTFFTGGSGTERARIDSSGNVGIGTSSPTARLQVSNSSADPYILVGGNSRDCGLLLNASTQFTALRADSANRLFVSSGAGEIVFTANGSERARISATGGFSVGTTADPGAGAIYATGNITAYYSDDRLKTRLGVIENALDKVDQLQGFYYEANETAQALGYKVKREVGVSAQSVQAVLPEIVSPAPIDQQYLTVDYERLVPLLIEAVKELRAEVKALKGE